MAKKADKEGFSFEDMLAEFTMSKECPMQVIKPYFLNQLWGGGLNFGSMYGAWGEKGCGKSSIGLQIISHLCSQGLRCVILDTESAVNNLQLNSFGLAGFVQSGLLSVLRPTTFLDVEKIGMSLADQDVSFVLWDSETMTMPATENNIMVTDNRPGRHAQQSAWVLTKLKGIFAKAGIASLVIFHARAYINMTGFNSKYDPQSRQAGGYAAMHVPDVLMHMKTGARLYEVDGDKSSKQIGHQVTIACEKNKFTDPFVPVQKKFVFGKGFIPRYEILDSALELGLVQQKGAYYYLPFDDIKINGKYAYYHLPKDEVQRLRALVFPKYETQG